MADEKETLGQAIGYPGSNTTAKKKPKDDEEDEGTLAAFKRVMSGFLGGSSQKTPAAQVSPSPKPKGK